MLGNANPVITRCHNRLGESVVVLKFPSVLPITAAVPEASNINSNRPHALDNHCCKYLDAGVNAILATAACLEEQNVMFMLPKYGLFLSPSLNLHIPTTLPSPMLASMTIRVNVLCASRAHLWLQCGGLIMY